MIKGWPVGNPEAETSDVTKNVGDGSVKHELWRVATPRLRARAAYPELIVECSKSTSGNGSASHNMPVSTNSHGVDYETMLMVPKRTRGSTSLWRVWRGETHGLILKIPKLHHQWTRWLTGFWKEEKEVCNDASARTWLDFSSVGGGGRW